MMSEVVLKEKLKKLDEELEDVEDVHEEGRRHAVPLVLQLGDEHELVEELVA